ncbi:MAG: DUF2905 domain-containing protein [Acidobacteria bacterium]|nr:DUF2905 domain-containing protein [Acidobacteriota bacterium]MBI3654796.1 DUF2905 domain-containing protein [Acidobacteriota bacterium]
MQSFGRLLMVLGVALLIVGALFVWGSQWPWTSRIGRLPGDLFFKKGHFTFYFPLATSILISIVLTILMLFFRGK